MSRALVLLIAQGLLVITGFTSARVLLSLYSLDIGASSAEVGIILALMFLVPGLLSLPIGMMADRMGGRGLLVASAAVQAVAVAAPFYYPTLTAMYIAATGIGVGMAFSSVIGQNLVGVLSRPEERTRNFSNYSMVGGLANFLGPLVTGFAIDHAGFRWSCLIGVAVAAFAAVLVAVWGGILPRGKPREKKGGNMLSTLGEPKLRLLLYVSSIGQIGVDCYMSFMPVYAHGAGLSASVIGTALAVLAVAVLLTRVALVRALQISGERNVMVGCFILGAAAFFALPLFKAASLLMVISFVFGLYMGFMQPIITMLMFSSSPPGSAGEALGLRLSANNMARVFAPVIFGATARAIGLTPLFVVAGLLMCLGGYLARHQEKRQGVS